MAKRSAAYNLDSPNRLLAPCDLADLEKWFEAELLAVDSRGMVDLLRLITGNLDEFVKWPEEAVLLWRGCDRVPREGARQRYHTYPQEIKDAAALKRVRLDGRANGPAIAAFLFADGQRPSRFGSTNAWSVHHLYSGKFPYFGKAEAETLHASKGGLHFTQSAGLVAVHPVADALVDEFPFFAWRLRAEAFNRLAYDPDGVFASELTELGFAAGNDCRILFDGS